MARMTDRVVEVLTKLFQVCNKEDMLEAHPQLLKHGFTENKSKGYLEKFNLTFRKFGKKRDIQIDFGSTFKKKQKTVSLMAYQEI